MGEIYAPDDSEPGAGFLDPEDIQRQLDALQELSDRMKWSHLQLVSMEMERRVVSAEDDWRRRYGTGGL